MTPFKRALEFTLGFEGGYVNDPDDLGGRTDRGISARWHPEAWADGAVTDEEVERIYREDYWLPAGCELLEWPLSLALFDTAVIAGVPRARSFLVDAGTPLSRALALVAARVAYHEDRAEKRPQSRKFLNGWKNRCASLASACITGRGVA